MGGFDFGGAFGGAGGYDFGSTSSAAEGGTNTNYYKTGSGSSSLSVIAIIGIVVAVVAYFIFGRK